jgi:hypothetical protein
MRMTLRDAKAEPSRRRSDHLSSRSSDTIRVLSVPRPGLPERSGRA